MPRFLLPLVLLLASVISVRSQVPVDADALVKKIQGELGPPYPDLRQPDPAVPHGEYLHGVINDSPIYPGTENPFSVYVPAQYDPAKPACLLVKLDGLGESEGNVLDGLIARKEVPVMIGVGVVPGSVLSGPPGTPKREVLRYNRSYEFDSVNDRFTNFVLKEVLPAVEKLQTRDGRAIHISADGNDHAATGGSTGGIGSFTLAWQRPDQFTRIYDLIGTFVSMRGGHEYPALIRKTDPKPIRIFLEDGSTDTWNPLFGSWFDANVNMESALSFAGYDVAHAWGEHGHDGRAGGKIFGDVMQWLWRDYPAPIKAGTSKNSTLQEIEVPEQGWEKVPQTLPAVAGLAANPQGEVYLSDLTSIYRLDHGDNPVAIEQRAGVVGQAFGADGTLYGVVPGAKQIIARNPQGETRTFADGIAGRGVTVTHDGMLYVSAPGEHSDMPSIIWQIKPDGTKRIIDQGLLEASGVAFAPNDSLFFAAERGSKWIYSYVVQPDGSLTDKQPFYWLHISDIQNDSGAEDLAVDTHGNLYVATRLGVQIADQNGRVRAILPLPTPCGPVRSLCFGGEHFDVLYVTDGVQVFRRKLKVPGNPTWAAPVAYPSQGAG